MVSCSSSVSFEVFCDGRARFGSLVDAVRDVIHHVETGDGALVEEIYRVRFLLTEQRNQDVRAGHFFLVGGLHMQDGALDHALEADGRLRVHFAGAGNDRRVGLDVLHQHGAQLHDVCATGTQHMRGRRIVQHRQQQVLDGDELVPFLACFNECQMQADFQFLRDHLIFLLETS